MNTRRGLTLFEIIVALIILSLVLVGMVNLFVASKKLIGHGGSRMTSAELGRAFVDNQNQLAVSANNWSTSCLNNQANCVGSTQQINNMSYTGSYSVSAVSNSNVRRVIVNITWDEPGS